MDESRKVEELLAKAVLDETITSAQRQLFLSQYYQDKITLEQILEQIQASLVPKSQNKHEPVLYGSYILKTCLGKGGMGEVYEAFHRRTGQRCALKKIRPGYGQPLDVQEKTKKRFLRECELQAKLEHPNIVQVHDFGSQDKELFLVTQIIDGETLQQYVARESRLPGYVTGLVPELLLQIKGVCEALHFAHCHEIIHRDVNPKNIMFDRQAKAWIMDFGLAKPLGPEVSKITKSTELIGTPSYMSPEQWTSGSMGPFSDVYSLGATLYFLVSGKPPQPEDPMAAAYNIINQIPPLPLSTHNSDIPDSLAQIITKAMAYSPEDRFHDMATLGEAIGQWVVKWKSKTKTISRKLYQSYKKVIDSLTTDSDKE